MEWIKLSARCMHLHGSYVANNIDVYENCPICSIGGGLGTSPGRRQLRYSVITSGHGAWSRIRSWTPCSPIGSSGSGHRTGSTRCPPLTVLSSRGRLSCWELRSCGIPKCLRRWSSSFGWQCTTGSGPQIGGNAMACRTMTVVYSATRHLKRQPTFCQAVWWLRRFGSGFHNLLAFMISWWTWGRGIQSSGGCVEGSCLVWSCDEGLTP
jgi:hypothetical protein